MRDPPRFVTRRTSHLARAFTAVANGASFAAAKGTGRFAARLAGCAGLLAIGGLHVALSMTNMTCHLARIVAFRAVHFAVAMANLAVNAAFGFTFGAGVVNNKLLAILL